MRSAAFLLVGCALVLVQGTVHRFFSLLESMVGAPWFEHLLHGATPDLVLPFVIYLGIHETSMARGASLSFGLGWAVDVLGGGPAFLFRFTLVAIWWLSRAASVRVSAQSTMTRIPLAFGASVVEGGIILALLAIFGADNRRPMELSTIILPRAISTAILAPFVFALAHRLNIDSRGPTATEPSQASK